MPNEFIWLRQFLNHATEYSPRVVNIDMWCTQCGICFFCNHLEILIYVTHFFMAVLALVQQLIECIRGNRNETGLPSVLGRRLVELFGSSPAGENLVSLFPDAVVVLLVTKSVEALLNYGEPDPVRSLSRSKVRQFTTGTDNKEENSWR